MATELYVTLRDPEWAGRHWQAMLAQIRSLATYRAGDADALWLKGSEAVGRGAWEYDVRWLPLSNDRLLLEISAHPPSIEADLRRFLSWLRAETSVTVEDEDGEPSRW